MARNHLNPDRNHPLPRRFIIQGGPILIATAGSSCQSWQMTLFVTHFVVNELSLRAVGKVLVAEKGEGGWTDFINPSHSWDWERQLWSSNGVAFIQTTIHRCQKPNEFTGGSKPSQRAVPVAQGNWIQMDEKHPQTTLFHLDLLEPSELLMGLCGCFVFKGDPLYYWDLCGFWKKPELGLCGALVSEHCGWRPKRL